MTEAEWRDYTHPGRMLAFLGDRLSGREFRLFACACCRTVWELMPDPRSRYAVEVAERFADGLVVRADAEQALRGGLSASVEVRFWSKATLGGTHPAVAHWAAFAAFRAAAADPAHCVGAWAQVAAAVEGRAFAADGATAESLTRWDDAIGHSNGECITDWSSIDPRAPLAALLRDIAGDPFRPVTPDPAWLTSTAVAVAAAIYAERTFHDLPILADALQDAGCDDAAVLGHCRGDGPHVRGCWVVDLVLGKR